MSSVTPQEFGNKIKQIRNQKNFSLRQVSNQSKIGDKPAISASYWSLVERGQRNIPKVPTLKRMAKGLRISNEEILNFAGLSANDQDKENAVDLDDENAVLTFQGKPVPPEDLALMRRLLRGKDDDE
ncbi:helix-turn-helix domain-containing protein [Lapidilactobacillus achengensis]|uniref:Helix-turn-helix domain-containing protein n=1 Tax=Lapidilactobacillus achengensis TaxID=2486000 RepID=A0ABW1UMM2_9LACO|nr:helix-turn-helix domain-containing protein [Lapidilactobacillus achengensis]